MFVVLTLGSTNSACAQSRLVLKSGFEKGVSVVRHPAYAQNHTLTGIDTATGADWDKFASELDTLRFAYVIGGRRNNPDDYVRTKILPKSGRNNSRGLLMAVHEDLAGDSEHTRNELSLFPKPNPKALFANQGYCRYWMKFDRDIEADQWPEKWYNFFEVKEQQVNRKENYRFNFRLLKDPPDQKPYWVMILHNAADDDYEVVERNRKVPVPIGEWFKVEAFWKRHSESGRLFLAIDGKLVFNFRGRTQHPTNPRPVRFWSPLKNYRHRAWHAGERVANVWYDDLELWTGWPAR